MAWRYVHYHPEIFSAETGELYDLVSDPDETRNLFAEQPAIVAECRQRLLDWLFKTTRVKTIWPTLTGDDWDRPTYRTGADGTLATGHDPSALTQRTELSMKNAHVTRQVAQRAPPSPRRRDPAAIGR